MNIPDWNKIGCPACGEKQSEDILDILAIPTEVGLLQNSRDKAINAPQGRILLSLCLVCGFVGNRAYDESLVRWQPGYEISLHFSDVYQKFLKQLSTRLIDEYNLEGKKIIEVGCAQGNFVRMLCAMSGSQGYGFDPSMNKEKTVSGSGYTVELIRDFYSKNSIAPAPDFLCSRHVLHEVVDPRTFLLSIAKAIGNERAVPIYFEVPNGDYIFGEKPRWNYMYEYVSYFHSISLSKLFNKTGFTPCKVMPCYEDGQYLSIDAHSGRSNASLPSDSDDLKEYIARVRHYRSAVNEQVNKWKIRLSGWKDHRIIAWGAGGRAISFFSALGVNDEIRYIVDINPDRQNMYLPGTGQKVITPNDIVSIDPEVVIVTNPTYEAEVRKTIADLGCSPEIISL